MKIRRIGGRERGGAGSEGGEGVEYLRSTDLLLEETSPIHTRGRAGARIVTFRGVFQVYSVFL